MKITSSFEKNKIIYHNCSYKSLFGQKQLQGFGISRE